MTQRFINNLPDLTISNTLANGISADAYGSFSDCETFTLFASIIDGSKTYVIQLSPDNVNWFTWTDGTANIIPPSTVGNCSTYGNPGARYIRILGSGATTGCTWKMQTSYYE